MSVGAPPRQQRRSSFPIHLDGEGLDLIESIEIRPQPGSEPPPDALFNSFRNGMGFHETIWPDSYGWGGNECVGDGPWGGVCTRIPGVVMPGGKITELEIQAPASLFPYRSSVVFQGNLFFFGGRYPVAVSGGTASVGTYTADFLSDNIATVINAATVFKGSIYVGTLGASGGTTGPMWSTSNGIVWVEHATVPRLRLSTVFWDSGGVGALRLVGMPTANTFKSVTGDPTVAANWSAEVSIDGAVAVQSIAASARHLYFCSPEGVFDVDARGHTANIAPDIANSYVSSNGGASIIHSGSLHVNVGTGVRRVPLSGVRDDEPEYYQPGADTSDGSPIWGYPAPPTRDHGWLVWAFWNPKLNRSYVMYARDKAAVGADVPGPMVWHGAESVYPGIITHMRVHSALAGLSTLWVCTEEPGARHRIFAQSLPFSGNPYQEWKHGSLFNASHRFAQNGSMYVGHPWERPATKTTVLGYNIESENTSNVAKISVWRRNNNEVDSSGNPVYTRKATARSSGYSSPRDQLNTSYPRIDFRFDFDGLNDDPPISRGIRIEADVNVIQRFLRRLTVFIASPQMTARGTRQRKKPASVIRHLRQLQSINATPFAYIDEDADEYRARMIPNSIERKTGEFMSKWGHYVTFMLEPLNKVIRWNTGENWNQSDGVWGDGGT